MAYPTQPTLVELRTSVLSRCGLATSGNVQRNITGLLNEKIRAAEEFLYEEAPWLVNYVTAEIALFEDEDRYDIPDDTEPGQIDAIGVRRIADQKIYPLEPGIRLGEANGQIGAVAMPQRYTFIDQELLISPMPDVDVYDVLVLRYRQVPNGLVNDTDPTVIEGPAMKAYAEILVKEHFGGIDTTALRADFSRYIDRRKGRQSDGAGFQMGGHQSARVATQPRNRFTSRRSSSADFHPW